MIGILSCLVLVLGGFFVYKQFIEKDEKPSNNIEDNKPISQEQELSLNDKVVLDLFETQKNYTSCDSINFVDILYKKSKTLVSSLSDKEKVMFLVDHILKYIDPTSSKNYYDFIDSKTVLNEWNKLYGNSIKFPTLTNDLLTTSDSDEDGFLQDGSYKKHSMSCDEAVLRLENDLLKSIKLENEIILYVRAKFIDFDEYGSSVEYYNYEKTKLLDNNIISPNYKIIFKKDVSDNYYFYSVEKVEN